MLYPLQVKTQRQKAKGGMIEPNNDDLCRGSVEPFYIRAQVVNTGHVVLRSPLSDVVYAKHSPSFLEKCLRATSFSTHTHLGTLLQSWYPTDWGSSAYNLRPPRDFSSSKDWIK